MSKVMKKVWLIVVISLIVLPIIANERIQVTEAYPIPPIVYFTSTPTRNPQFPDQDEEVEITCSVYHSGGSSLTVKLYYRFNGGSFNDVYMSAVGGMIYKRNIPGGNIDDVVEYYLVATAIADYDWVSTDRAPNTGYYSYVVSQPSELSWISPSDGTEITFGPVDNNIEFNFDWSFTNLDDVELDVDGQVFDILTAGGMDRQVTLNGESLEDRSVSATLKGYKSNVMVLSTSRTFSFRRLDYDLQWVSPSEGNTIAFSPSGSAKFNFTFTQGIDIDHVNLFFNDSDMGEVTSPSMLEFPFENHNGTIVATLKGYDSGDNLVATNNRTFTFRRLVVEVVWNTPSNGTKITYGIGSDPVLFNFTFSKGTDVAYVKLELNTLDMGVVSSPGTVSFEYNDSFHGPVEAILIGFDESDSQISTDMRKFIFEKIVTTRFEILKNNTYDLGKKLYLILHDPNGDDSTSSYEESTTLSLGIGCEITAGVTVGLEVGVEENFDFFGLFSTGIEASNKLSLSMEASLGFDARFEISDSTFLSSSDSSDVNYIGPGYGDRYWGELWKFSYVLTINYIEYYNTSQVYYDPHLWWGIIRDAESYLSDANAPEKWRAMNPVHQNYPEDQIEWIGGTLVADGGGTYINSHEVTATNTLSESITIGLEDETKVKLSAGGAYVEGSLVLSLNTKVYAEQSVSNTIKTEYTVRDDDPTDSIVQKVGIDKNFGTYIFKTEPGFCATSNPIEHNTKDYIPPIIHYPTIIYDTDQDFKGPTPQDNPLVTVKIEEEGGVQDATLYYSIDNETSWRSVQLLEYPGQPGIWHTNIPKQANKTTVLWYLQVWDNSGNTEVKFDLTGENFSYEVGILINPLESATPGFTILSVLVSIAVCAALIKNRKHLE
jgi:hypothetical protein